MSDAPVFQEAFYRDGRTSETERLTSSFAPTFATIRVPVPPPLLIGLVGGIMLGAGLFLFGYRLGYLAGVLQPWVDARGWIALLFVAIGAPMLMIWHGNNRA